MKNHTLATGLLKKVAGASIKTASSNMNTACVWWLHQPKPPKSAEKLKKHYE